MGGPNNGKQIELMEGKKITVGRSAQCEIQIEHPTISRRHAEISFSWNGAFVKDLDSANGVYCNDQRIGGTYKLRDRDEIRLGQQNINDPVRLIFSNPAEALLSKIEEAQITDGLPAQRPRSISLLNRLHLQKLSSLLRLRRRSPQENHPVRKLVQLQAVRNL